MNNTIGRWEIPSLGLEKLALREVPRPVPRRSRSIFAMPKWPATAWATL